MEKYLEEDMGLFISVSPPIPLLLRSPNDLWPVLKSLLYLAGISSLEPALIIALYLILSQSYPSFLIVSP